MFASKYRGGISSKRIINAFEFLKKRSEEAALAAKREAAVLEREATLAVANSGQTTTNETSEDDKNATNRNFEENSSGVKRRRPPWEDEAKSSFPKGGAGLVSLMGDASSLEKRIQGGWNLVIKAGGRCVLVWKAQRRNPFDTSFLLQARRKVKVVRDCFLPCGVCGHGRHSEMRRLPKDEKRLFRRPFG